MFIYEKHLFGDAESFSASPHRDFNFPYHFHRSFELISVTEGTLSLDIDSKLHQLKTGDLAYVFPNQLHSFTTTEHSQIMIVIFSPEMIADFSAKYKNLLPESFVLPYHPLYAEDLNHLNIYQRKAFLYTMCGMLVEQTAFSARNSGTSQLKLLHQILSYVDSHLEDICTLAAAAHELGYDYSYLSKFFQGKMGISFTGYLNQYRITHACHLLHNTQESISTIAMKSGYDTIRTFNRNFKKVTGLSPNSYRNRA